MIQRLEKLQTNLRDLGYDEEETRWEDFRTLDELRELTRGISDSLDTELQKLNILLYEVQGNRRFTKSSELVQEMIEVKSAEREGWEKILDTINFLSY